MFDWITKPQIMWTPIDSLICIIELLIFILIAIKIFNLIGKILDYFDSKKDKHTK